MYDARFCDMVVRNGQNILYKIRCKCLTIGAEIMSIV